MTKAPALTQLSYPVLLQYITQKICHDLATPIGAIRLGLEHMEPNDLTPLLMESIDNATARIDAFRTLFSTATDTLDSPRVTKQLQAYLKAKNITCTGAGHAQGTFARLLLGLGIVCCEALPRGGTITVDFDHLIITCEGPIIHMPYTQFDRTSLLKENLNFKSGIILFHVLFLAEAEKLTLECMNESDALVLSFKEREIA
ncbi:MAG: hypothetical protein K2X53_00205 [Alphaproteobacteria bacterium]|nr:hypothetical protein [Alphaproteobacteria bacterium]